MVLVVTKDQPKLFYRFGVLSLCITIPGTDGALIMRCCDQFNVSGFKQESLDRTGSRDDWLLPLKPDSGTAISTLCATFFTNVDLSLAWPRLDFLPNTLTPSLSRIRTTRFTMWQESLSISIIRPTSGDTSILSRWRRRSYGLWNKVDIFLCQLHKIAMVHYLDQKPVVLFARAPFESFPLPPTSQSMFLCSVRLPLEIH